MLIYSFEQFLTISLLYINNSLQILLYLQFLTISFIFTISFTIILLNNSLQFLIYCFVFRPSARSASSIILRGPNDFYCDEMERSIHDALCVVRRVLESSSVVCGGGAVEAALSVYLENFATTLVSILKNIIYFFICLNDVYTFLAK